MLVCNVTAKLRNHLTDHHETWPWKYFFPEKVFMLSILLSLTIRWRCNTSTSIPLGLSPQNLVRIDIFSWRNFLCCLFTFTLHQVAVQSTSFHNVKLITMKFGGYYNFPRAENGYIRYYVYKREKYIHS